MRDEHAPLVVAALALAVLPFALDIVGLPLRTSIDVVVFAIACMGLNVLVGYTGFPARSFHRSCSRLFSLPGPRSSPEP